MKYTKLVSCKRLLDINTNVVAGIKMQSMVFCHEKSTWDVSSVATRSFGKYFFSEIFPKDARNKLLTCSSEQNYGSIGHAEGSLLAISPG